MMRRLAGLLAAATLTVACSSSDDSVQPPVDGNDATAPQPTASPDPTTAAASTSTVPPASTSPPSLFDPQPMLDEWVGDGRCVGAVATVSAGGRTVAATAGVAEAGTTDAVDADGRSPIGSITKLFTATLAMKLQEEGVLSVDDPIADYVPEAPQDVTIAHLLSHTSGIPDGDVLAFLEQALNDPSSLPSPAEQTAVIVQRQVESVPGERYSYCNDCYVLLGEVIAAAAGMEYEAALTEFVLEPLGLDDTGFDGTEADIWPPNVILGSGEPVSRALLDTDRIIRSYGAGGALISDARDLTTFAEALLGGEIISAASLARMAQPTDASGGIYGLGIDVWGLLGATVYGHDGGDPVGYTAALRHEPAAGLTVVVFCNQFQADITPFAHELIVAASTT